MVVVVVAVVAVVVLRGEIAVDVVLRGEMLAVDVVLVAVAEEDSGVIVVLEGE